jgi:hypothetical protein
MELLNGEMEHTMDPKIDDIRWESDRAIIVLAWAKTSWVDGLRDEAA